MPAKPSFNRIWSAYSKANHNCSMALHHQCAVRMSRALIDAGWPSNTFKSAQYTGKVCPHGYARGAQDLAAYLRRVWGNRDVGWSKPGSVPANASGVKGLICFMNIPGFGGQGHIDLWDGSETKTGAYWGSDTIWLWKL